MFCGNNVKGWYDTWCRCKLNARNTVKNILHDTIHTKDVLINCDQNVLYFGMSPFQGNDVINRFGRYRMLYEIYLWINANMDEKCIHNKVWDEIAYAFPNFYGATTEVWVWINNFIPHFPGYVITCPCLDLSQSLLIKSVLANHRLRWFINSYLHGYFAGNGVIVWLPQCHWSNPEGYKQTNSKTQQNANWKQNSWEPDSCVTKQDLDMDK